MTGRHEGEISITLTVYFLNLVQELLPINPSAVEKSYLNLVQELLPINPSAVEKSYSPVTLPTLS